MNLRTINTRRRRRERLSQWSGIWEITWAYEAAENARASGFTGLTTRADIAADLMAINRAYA